MGPLPIAPRAPSRPAGPTHRWGTGRERGGRLTGATAAASPCDHRAYDVLVIGGGQAGLAVGYYLRRAGLSFVILDRAAQPGGAWREGWSSLRLFSPARYSSLPGRQMPPSDDGFPAKDDVVAYLTDYETRYELPVRRPVAVTEIRRGDRGLLISSDAGTWRASAVVSATGTWSQPFVPAWPGLREFRGTQLHTVSYRDPEPFRGRHVVVVGGGNSGAQILAEVSRVAETTWVTRQPPRFLPDEVDGRVLFERATRRLQQSTEKDHDQDWDREDHEGGGEEGLRQIVMVPPVREARQRGVLSSRRPFSRLTAGGVVWPDGSSAEVDAVIWCTGFRPHLRHLRLLGLRGERGEIAVEATRSTAERRLWLVGYGDWTGPASATLIGVGRSAKSTVEEIAAGLETQRTGGYGATP